MYIATDYATPVSVNGAGDGLFQSATTSPAGRHIILTTDEHGRYAIFIDSSQAQFHFYELKSANLRASGLLYDAPRIEFDPADCFDATKQHEELGDLILTSGGAAIMAVSAASNFADPMRFPLWRTETPSDGVAIGFKRWRLVVGPIEKPIVIWERPTIPLA